MPATDPSPLLLRVALGDLVLALLLAVTASLLLRAFLLRLVERHRKVAMQLLEPVQGRGLRLYAYLKSRASRHLNDPRAHALAFSAYLCVIFAALLAGLSVLTLAAALLF
ncbi:MAG: hypothetical protein HYV17_16340 [Xanthomonadales bacterium]|nr:hypothetical protein [Xanthomonadales bacterium]